MSVVPSTGKLETPPGLYIAEVVSFDNKILNLTFFDIPTEMFVDYADPETGEIVGGDIIKLNQSSVTLYVPYFENAQEINIYDWDLNKKLTLKVSDFAKDTVVSVEGVGEEEAKIKEGATTAPSEMVEKEPEKSMWWLIFIGLGILLLLVLLIIVIVRNRKKI